jgi:hypothetical protein
MALVQKTKHSHSGVWTFLASDLGGGVTLTIATGIRLVAKNGGYNSALDQCRAIFKVNAKIGTPIVPDPELTAVNGLLVCTIINSAPPGNGAGGEVTVEYLHSARR